MSLQGIDFVAVYAAIVATIVLLWDFFKWWRTGPVIRPRIAKDVYFDDGRIISEEITENGTDIIPALYCYIELVNNGTSPTTIYNILATHKITRNCKGQMSSDSRRFTEHFGKKMPYVLNPGELWSCRIEMGDFENLNQIGQPEVHVFLSHLKKPLKLKVPIKNTDKN